MKRQIKKITRKHYDVPKQNRKMNCMLMKPKAKKKPCKVLRRHKKTQEELIRNRANRTKSSKTKHPENKGIL